MNHILIKEIPASTFDLVLASWGKDKEHQHIKIRDVAKCNVANTAIAHPVVKFFTSYRGDNHVNRSMAYDPPLPMPNALQGPDGTYDLTGVSLILHWCKDRQFLLKITDTTNNVDYCYSMVVPSPDARLPNNMSLKIDSMEVTV